MELEPILYHLRKAFHGINSTSIESCCDKSWQIAPGGADKFPTAIFLPKHLSMDLKTVDGITLSYEIERVKGRKVQYAPTFAYQISEAKLLDGILYKGNYRLKLNKKKESLFNYLGNINVENEGMLVSSWSSNTYFGHWVMEECSRIRIASDLGIPPYCTEHPLFLHQSGYENIFNLKYFSTKRAIFKKLIVLSDATLNNHKQKYFLQLRELVAISILPENNTYIYIKRGSGGVEGRSLVNENLLIDRLKNYGFVIIEPEKLAAYEIMQKCLNAKIIVGIEGSSLAHGFLGLHSTGILIALMPEYQFNNPFQDYCSAIGLRYGFLVGKTVKGGFSVDLDDMEELLMMIKN